jgi:hypothetical protein
MSGQRKKPDLSFQIASGDSQAATRKATQTQSGDPKPKIHIGSARRQG